MKMYKLGRYKQTDRMSDLICENYPMLLVLSRFGISLGFGDKTIGEVCEDSGVDTKTFLTIVNLLLDDHTTAEQIDPSLSVEALVSYLQNSHSYFLDFRLLLIRRKLIEAIDCGHSDVSFAIMRYFDQYVAEVRKHMNYEETTVFPYVRSLVQGKSGNGKYHIGIFSKQHDQVESRLAELKNIIIKYYPATGSNELNSVLFDIFSCATDLASHNRIEDNLFVPLIAELERKNGCSR